MVIIVIQHTVGVKHNRCVIGNVVKPGVFALNLKGQDVEVASVILTGKFYVMMNHGLCTIAGNLIYFSAHILINS